MARKMEFIHLGIVLREEVIKAHTLTVTKAAELLRVSRPALSNVLNAKADISPEMALRITAVFGGRAQFWLSMQADYNLQEAAIKIRRLNLRPFKHTA